MTAKEVWTRRWQEVLLAEFIGTALYLFLGGALVVMTGNVVYEAVTLSRVMTVAIIGM